MGCILAGQRVQRRANRILLCGISAVAPGAPSKTDRLARSGTVLTASGRIVQCAFSAQFLTVCSAHLGRYGLCRGRAAALAGRACSRAEIMLHSRNRVRSPSGSVCVARRRRDRMRVDRSLHPRGLGAGPGPAATVDHVPVDESRSPSRRSTKALSSTPANRAPAGARTVRGRSNGDRQPPSAAVERERRPATVLQ